MARQRVLWMGREPSQQTLEGDTLLEVLRRECLRVWVVIHAHRSTDNVESLFGPACPVLEVGTWTTFWIPAICSASTNAAC